MHYSNFKSFLFFMSRLLITCHVLILAPFIVPVKLQFWTYTSSTVSWAPCAPKLPTLNEVFIIVYLFYLMVSKCWFNLKTLVFSVLKVTKLYYKMRLWWTNLIPWPGPHETRVILIWAVFPLMAIQSSPISINGANRRKQVILYTKQEIYDMKCIHV